MSHTPGPWMFSGERPFRVRTAYTAYGLGQLDICDVASQASETQSNARLIAAAPELLSALEEAIAYIADDEHERFDDTDVDNGGAPISYCALDEQDWPCRAARVMDKARALLARLRSPEEKGAAPQEKPDPMCLRCGGIGVVSYRDPAYEKGADVRLRPCPKCLRSEPRDVGGGR